jgi:DNA-binding MarR family transcriptional regulator
MKKNQSLIRGELAASMLELTTFTIFKSGQYIEQKFAQLFDTPPLKVRHFAILRVLIHGEAQTQQELGEALWIDRATLTVLIKDLLRLKMIKRLSHAEDRRSYFLQVTPVGQRFYRKFVDQFTTLEAKIFPKLSARELTLVRSILRKALLEISSAEEVGKSGHETESFVADENHSPR